MWVSFKEIRNETFLKSFFPHTPASWCHVRLQQGNLLLPINVPALYCSVIWWRVRMKGCLQIADQYRSGASCCCACLISVLAILGCSLAKCEDEKEIWKQISLLFFRLFQWTRVVVSVCGAAGHRHCLDWKDLIKHANWFFTKKKLRNVAV